MIPPGYAHSIVVWATRAGLSDGEQAARKQQLLDEHDALMSGQLGAKPSRTLVGGTVNGQSFTWNSDITAAEKLVVLTTVLVTLGLAPAGTPTVTYGNFSGIRR